MEEVKKYEINKWINLIRWIMFKSGKKLKDYLILEYVFGFINMVKNLCLFSF